MTARSAEATTSPFPDTLARLGPGRARGVVRWAGLSAALLGAAAALIGSGDGGLPVLPWVAPASELVCLLAASAVALAAYGDFRARRARRPLLVALGFGVAGLLGLAGLLVIPDAFPSLRPAGGPSLAAYGLLALHLALGAFLLAAAAEGADRPVSRRHARSAALTTGALALAAAAVLHAAGGRLPDLYAGNGHGTALLHGLALAAALLMTAAAVAHRRALGRTRDPVAGYAWVAAALGALWAVLLGASTRPYDPLWYAGGLLRALEHSIPLLVILGGHASLRHAAGRSEERYRALVDAVADDAVFLLHPGGRIASWNGGAERITGYRADEVVGTHVSRLFPAEDLLAGRPVLELDRAASLGRFEGEGERVRRDGSRFWATVRTAAIRDDAGGLVGFTSVVRDVTARMRAEEALRENEASFRLLVAHNPLPMWVYDTETLRFLEVNDAALRHYGYARDEFLRMRLVDLLPPDELGSACPAAPAAHGGPWPAGEWRHRLKDGRLIDVEATQHVLAFSGRRAALVVARDVTLRKRVERELRALAHELERRMAERTAQLEAANQELEAFSYSVSHDLRAPLRSIDGFSQALLEAYPDRLDARGQDWLRRIRAATQRMAHLIDDLLTLSRVARGELRRVEVDLSTMVRSIAEELRRGQPDRRVAFAVADRLVANGDPRLLRVALENLVGNAWKFTGKHAEARIEFGLTRDAGVPAYFVRDDGAGFDMAYADKLFAPFQRLHRVTEFEGTGVGLATVQRIIHRHGGRVWAEGAVERGATFYFTL